MAGERCRFRPLEIFLTAVLLLGVDAPGYAAHAHAHEVDGRVISVSDGDTLTVLSGHARLRVRLAEIDAPERGQPFGRRARLSLVALCQDRDARVFAEGHDRYGRIVGRVSCGGIDVNGEQVRRGLAWVYTRYARRDSPLYDMERQARRQRLGLWDGDHPLPPWLWRRHRAARAA